MNKLYVGKVFKLKRVNMVPWWSHNTTHRARTSGLMHLEDIGKHVLVVDESTKRVKIITKNKQLVWISKYYLSKEVYAEQSGFNINSELDRCLGELIKLSDSEDVGELSQNKLYDLIVSVRNIKDSLEKE
jgi:hypothetical protein